ncbi:hypothetical protein ABFX02_04G051800 [Erythranthe guttata]
MVTVTPQNSSYSLCSRPYRIPSTIHRQHCSVAYPLFSSRNLNSGLQKFPRTVNCRRNGSADSENESRAILDAFFLGKAVAEALNERIESSVGEFLSTIGRLQAEQQKQVQEFQDEVLEKARRAKEQAAREAMEAKGLIPKASTFAPIPPVNEVASKSASAVDSSIDASISTIESSPTTEQDPPKED